MMMDKAHFEIAVRKIVPFTDYVYLHLMGEPLLHPELPSFLEILKSNDLKCCLTTNGTLLDKRKDELIRAADGIHKISISLQAQEANEAFGINAAGGSANVNGIGSRSLVTGEKYLRSCFEFALEAEKSTLIVLRLWNKGGLEENNGTILKIMEEYFPRPWKDHPLGYKIGEKTYLEFGDKFDWPDYNIEDTAPANGRYYCYGLKDQIGILVDGTVVPCCLDNNGRLGLGNIFREDLPDILKNLRASSICEGFKNGIAAEELCKKCGFAMRFQ